MIVVYLIKGGIVLDILFIIVFSVYFFFVYKLYRIIYVKVLINFIKIVIGVVNNKNIKLRSNMISLNVSVNFGLYFLVIVGWVFVFFINGLMFWLM